MVTATPRRALVAALTLCLTVCPVLAGCTTTTTAGAGSRVSTSGSVGSVTPSASASGIATTQSAGELLTTAIALLKTTPSVRIAGVVLEAGATTTIDFGYHGADMSGVVTTAGFPISLMFIDRVIYYKAPDGFWLNSLGAARARTILPIVSGKWISETSTEAGYKDFLELADRSTFVDSIFGDTPALTKAGLKTVHGVPCVGLDGGTDGLVYLATNDARPIAIVPSANSTDTGEVTFSQYGSVAAPTVPPAAQTVDGATIGR